MCVTPDQKSKIVASVDVIFRTGMISRGRSSIFSVIPPRYFEIETDQVGPHSDFARGIQGHLGLSLADFESRISELEGCDRAYSLMGVLEVGIRCH